MTELESLLFNISISPNTPQQGALLIAEPFLREEFFCHAVICLVDYDENKSTMGIVLNKPTSYNLDEVIPNITLNTKIPVYCGGPVSYDRLFYIHTLGNIIPNSKLIHNGLYIGGDLDAIIDYINLGFKTTGMIRFFIGNSGWGAGQLDNELKQYVWAVTNPTNYTNLLIGEGDKYWRRYVKTMGKEYRGWHYHPENPKMN